MDCIGPGELVDEFISILVSGSQQLECKNPMQLANADPLVLFTNLSNECRKKKIPPPELSSVTEWVDAAQEVAHIEIILDKVNGDEEVLCCLHNIGATEESDFLARKMVEIGLAEEVEALVISWTCRAQIALTLCPWLGEFSST